MVFTGLAAAATVQQRLGLTLVGASRALARAPLYPWMQGPQLRHSHREQRDQPQACRGVRGRLGRGKLAAATGCQKQLSSLVLPPSHMLCCPSSSSCKHARSN